MPKSTREKRIKRNVDDKLYTQHALSYWAHTYDDKLGFSPLVASTLTTSEGKAPLEVSHRCHNKKCWNPGHLLVETSKLNKVRLIDSCSYKLVYQSFKEAQWLCGS